MSSLRPALGGADSLEMEATTLRELMRMLCANYPGVKKQIDAGVAVAVNGEIYRDNRDVALRDGSEVFLMPRIQGG